MHFEHAQGIADHVDSDSELQDAAHGGRQLQNGAEQAQECAEESVSQHFGAQEERNRLRRMLDACWGGRRLAFVPFTRRRFGCQRNLDIFFHLVCDGAGKQAALHR